LINLILFQIDKSRARKTPTKCQSINQSVNFVSDNKAHIKITEKRQTEEISEQKKKHRKHASDIEYENICIITALH